MRSMTGFGYAELREETRSFALTVKSYNNRFLEIFVYLPTALGPLEPRFRGYVSARVLRGRVELYLKAEAAGAAPALLVDPANVRAHLEALRRVAEAAGLKERIRLTHLLRLEGILKPEQAPDLEAAWQALQPLLETAFEGFQRTRIQEGEATRRDIDALLAKMGEEVAGVESQAGRLEEKVREDLRARFRQLLGEGVDESRVMAETAVALMKADVHEELSRLRAHLQSFSVDAAQEGAVGKRLDFLCQEMNREVNTVGSKSALPEVDARVVSMKDTLEKIREQLRNVE
jgi:uncharacterized protein (TIGR00255 family)